MSSNTPWQGIHLKPISNDCFGSHETLCSSVVLEYVYMYTYMSMHSGYNSSDINQAQYSWGKKPLTCGSSPSPYPPSFTRVGFNSLDSSDKVWSACWCFWTSQMTLQQQQLCLQLLLNLAISQKKTHAQNRHPSHLTLSKKATNKKVSKILNCQKEHQFCYLLFLGGFSHCRWIGITFNVAILSSNLRYSPAIFEHLQHSKSWNW